MAGILPYVHGTKLKTGNHSLSKLTTKTLDSADLDYVHGMPCTIVLMMRASKLSLASSLAHGLQVHAAGIDGGSRLSIHRR